jgi:hypothetical protein
MQTRTFGLEEANRLVPHLTRTFETVRGLVARTRALQSRVVLLPRESTQRLGLETERDALMEKVKTELAGLDEIGVEIKDVEGLVDFPAQMEGRSVLLCWRYPEARVDHWHELDSGFAGRRLIDDGHAFERSFLS